MCGQCPVDDFIGQTFPTPKGGVLTVVGLSDKKCWSNRLYKSTCSICSLDTELFPDLFEIRKSTLVRGTFPCGCSKFPKWKPFQVEIIVGRLCEEIGYEFICFPEGYKNANSKFEYLCPTHGKQTVSYGGFVNIGSRCPDCGTESMTDKKRNSESETIVKELCEKEGYEYIGFPKGYKTKKSKFEYNCPIHGKQTVSYGGFVYSGSRCPDCGVNKKRNSESETIVKELCDKEGYEYLGFPKGYKNTHSKLEYNCPIHGKQTVSYDGFVYSGSRCPSCADYGYQPANPGEIYFTFWTDPDHKATTEYELFEQSDVYTKIGITNKSAKERVNQQARKNKLVPNNMLTMRFEDGRIPQILEDMTKPFRQNIDINTGKGEYLSKEEFEDGYTEILSDYYGFNIVLPLMIDYIKEHNLTPEVTVGKKLFDKLMKVKKHSTMWGHIQDYKDNFYKTIKCS